MLMQNSIIDVCGVRRFVEKTTRLKFSYSLLRLVSKEALVYLESRKMDFS